MLQPYVDIIQADDIGGNFRVPLRLDEDDDFVAVLSAAADFFESRFVNVAFGNGLFLDFLPTVCFSGRRRS